MTVRPHVATVFATNLAPGYIYDSAERFGTLRPITSGTYPVFKSVRLLEEIATALVESSDDDFLLFSGSGFVGGMCLLVWFMLHPTCKALLYDRRQGGYVSRVLRREDVALQLEQARDRAERRRA